MVIDVHTHIFPPRVIAGRGRFFPGEPEFRLLYESSKSRMADAGDLIAAMDRDGIDRSVVFGFPWRSADLLARHNDYVAEAAAGFPDRLIPLACLDLLSPGCIEEARKRLREGVAGFGELALYTAAAGTEPAMENFREVAALCRESGAVLLAHANEPLGHQYPGKAPFGLDFYYSMAKAAAGVKLIFAHWGGGILFFELLKKEAREVLADVYYDTAASPFLYQRDIYPAAVRIAGENKILFGSDFPLISAARYFEEMKSSGLSDAHIWAISGTNAARLFGIRS